MRQSKLFTAAITFTLLAAMVVGCAGPSPTPTPTPTPAPTPTWLSVGPRGVQYTSDFQLVERFRDTEGYYADFKLGPEGKHIYTLWMPSYPERDAVLVRLYGPEEERLQTEEVLDFSELTDPALWDPGIDLSGAVIGVVLRMSGDDLLSVASNGDLFLVAGAWSVDSRRGAPPLGVSLIVLHPDGSRQKVLTIRELVEAGLLDLTNADRGASLAVVASAPDRLWVKTETFPTGEIGFTRFYQVQDPDGDGDWSDRTVLPLSLPPSLPTGEGAEQRWLLRQMVAEPSLGGEDRSRSFLLPALNPRGEYHIYRVSDLNSDGDALDAGEFELLFKGFTGSPEAVVEPPVIAPRVVVRNGEVVLRELVVTSLTGVSRVSRLSESGELMDIARAFPSFEDLFADPEGNIYVVTQLPRLGGDGAHFVMYKLRPLVEGERAEPEAAVVTTQPAPTPPLVTGAITPGVPQIAYTRQVYDPENETSEVFLVGADGSGPSKLVPGEHNDLCCQSPGGSRIAYLSDEEVPNEQFVYVANADGSNPMKVTEKQVGVWWGSEEWLLLVVRTGAPATLIRHDLESGQETILLTDVPEWSVSPDGRRLLFVSGLDYSTHPTTYLPEGEESLEVLDLETGERRLLHGPLMGTSYHRLRWSFDGQRLGYFVGRWRHKQGPVGPSDFDLYVTDLLSGETKLVYRAGGVRPYPSFTWSPSGSWLLVEVERGEPTEEEILKAREQGEPPRVLRMELVRERFLVNVETGEARPWKVEGENVVRYGWAPNEDLLVYRVGQTLYSQSVDGDVRKLATVFGDECPGYGSVGWSPDGRYIGLSDYWQTIAILDTTTGEVRILFQEEGENAFIFPHGWWQ